jgi:curli production assembly/transport component CsgF
MKKTAIVGLLMVAPFLLIPPASNATELVYVPVNPSFGGSPLNGPFLLGQAEAQNKFKDKTGFESDPFDDFNESLQRRILSAFANKVVNNVDGTAKPEDQLKDGEYLIGDFLINVTTTGDGVNVVISDPLTGRRTEIDIPNM